MTCLDCIKDPERRSKLQATLGVAVHSYKGRKTKREKEQEGAPDSESEVEEEEVFEGYYDESDEEEDEEEDEDEEEEEEEEEPMHEAYRHVSCPREVEINTTTKSSPGPFHRDVNVWHP
eukprot:TRINITY_DN8569_c0_g1_i1.p2 TRINITY_DN8569_c0_g1~~TRINITY_DN8569_c0_g1_i1.p2  ORF type:complete len:119 (+),score=48.24 TRINITY_DN8569_c0_g1_i1:534-890(+)